MTAVQRDAIPSPPQGLIIYCTTCGENGELQIFNGVTYTNLIGGARAVSVIPGIGIQRDNDIDGEAVSDQSGYSISLSSDGKLLAIGAPGNSSGKGHVRVYYWNDTSWIQVGSDIDGEAVGDKFGWSVSLSANGSLLAVGAIDNDGNGSSSGHVRTFLISR
jgi:hypothetical protein